MRWCVMALPLVVVLAFVGEPTQVDASVDGRNAVEDQWRESNSESPNADSRDAVQELIDTVRGITPEEAGGMQNLWAHKMQAMSDLSPDQVRSLWKQVHVALMAPSKHTMVGGRIQTVTGPRSSLWKQVFHAVKGSGLTQANAKHLTSLFRHRKSLGGVIVMKDHSGSVRHTHSHSRHSLLKAHLAHGKGTAYFKSYAKEELKEQRHHHELENNRDTHRADTHHAEFQFKDGDHRDEEERAEKAGRHARVAERKAEMAGEKHEKALEIVKKSHERHEKLKKRKETRGKEAWFKKERWTKKEKSKKSAERSKKAEAAKLHQDELNEKSKVHEEHKKRDDLQKSQEIHVKNMVARMVEQAKKERTSKGYERGKKQERSKKHAERSTKRRAEKSQKMQSSRTNEVALKKARHLYHALREGKLNNQAAHENEKAKRDVKDLKDMLNKHNGDEDDDDDDDDDDDAPVTHTGNTIVHRRRRHQEHGNGHGSENRSERSGSSSVRYKIVNVKKTHHKKDALRVGGSLNVPTHTAKKPKVVIVTDSKETVARAHVMPLIPERSSGGIKHMLIAEGDNWAE